MKVIELLTKIANGEEVPKRVLYNEETYSYVERNRLFAKYIKEPFNARIPYYLFTDVKNIYDEIETIEEDKKIEKLREPFLQEETLNYVKLLKSKINELIDKINEEK